MAAPVRIESAAFADPRIELLGQLAGYNRYEALGRLAHLWSACTEKQAHVASEALVRACIGPAGVQHMLEAELAERVDGGLRIKGTDGRIEWLGDLSSKRQHAGRERAAKAARDARGRLLPAHAGDAGPSTSSTVQHTSSTPPAKSSALTLTPTSTLRLIPSEPAQEAGTKGRRAPEHVLPAAWKPDAAHAATARERGVDLHLEAERFRAHADANDRRARNWGAAFRQWLLRAQPDRRVAAQSEIRTNLQPL